MDECLIHSEFPEDGSWNICNDQLGEAKALGESKVDTFDISLPNGAIVCAHERPGLREFLHQVSQKCKTHVFTAGMDFCARPLLDVLDPHGTIFTHRWHRESCSLDSSMGVHVKNLSVGWGDR
jgi:TFIIF-interacting CTD phosphatase-like protein